MKNKKKCLFLVSLLFCFSIFLVNLSSAQENIINIHFFYGKGCPHCGNANLFLDELVKNNSNIILIKHETYFNDSEVELFHKFATAYNSKIQGVPTTYVGDEIFVGFSNEISKEINSKIINCLNKEPNESCIDPLEKVNNFKEKSNVEKLTVPAVISAALVDAINPCAFAVLIILMSTILASKNRKKALLAGLSFSLSIFISYFLMGLGLYSAIQAAGLSHTFYFIVAILAILIGLFNLKDFLWYGKWFKMEVPDSWRPKMKSLIKSVTSAPGAFLIGFAVSLFLLPCTSGPYIVILGLLSKAATKSYAILLLILYNFIFIIPMILINLAIFFGLTTTEKAEKLRQSKLKVLHLIAGIIILCLGIGMLISIKLGFV